MTAYRYNMLGDRYHTRNCQAVTAHDAMTRTAPTKDEVPEGRSKCGHCERIEANGQPWQPTGRRTI